MATLQLLIIRSRRIIGVLCVNCIFIRFLTLDPSHHYPPVSSSVLERIYVHCVTGALQQHLLLLCCG